MSVTPDDWAIGVIAPEGPASQACDATNDGNVNEDFTISVSGSDHWTAGATAAENVFVMEEGVTVLSGTPVSLATGVVPAAADSFTLNFTAPSAGSVSTEQTIIVTVTASPA
ncbi:hypothetical protein ACFL2J_02085 [Candidatus Omnitrophota bacterium]